MSTALLVVSVAFAAFAVWLAVRIVNRRERWAKRTAIFLPAVLALYPLSFGPVCWKLSRGDYRRGSYDAVFAPVPRWVNNFYVPIVQLWVHSPRPIRRAMHCYANVGAQGGEVILMHSSRNERYEIHIYCKYDD